MLKTPPDVIVYPNEVKPGDEFYGYEYISGDSHIMSMCQIVIGDDGTPLVWGRTPLTDPYDYFIRRRTWQEIEQWYIDQVDMSKQSHSLNLIGLHEDLYSVGDAYHEMWNGWISTSWEEQIVSLEDEDFFIIGIAPAPRGFTGCRDPIAVVCEYYDNGERFWCHAEKDWIDDMREESKEIYDKLMK